MTSYTLINKQSTITVTESAGHITASSVDILIGLPWDVLLSHCKARGFTVIPELDERPFCIRGLQYLFYWNGEKVTRIIEKDGEDERELRWSEIPEGVRRAV
jgi:hypothetical protein